MIRLASCLLAVVCIRAAARAIVWAMERESTALLALSGALAVSGLCFALSAWRAHREAI